LINLGDEEERIIVRRIGIGLTAALLGASLAAPAAASKPQSPTPGLEGGHRVTICHATSSSNPDNYWIVITVDIASSGGRNKFEGHYQHANEPNKKDGRGDAIPSFAYPGFPAFMGIGQDQAELPADCRESAGLATLTLIKTVMNDDSGNADVSEFGITTDAPGFPGFDGGDGGVPTTIYTAGPFAVASGTYSLSELEVGGYDEGEWECTDGGGGPFDETSVSLDPGEVTTCSITNDDQGGG
jgi:hypothetical protein